MVSLLKAANLVLLFLFELAALVMAGYWGFTLDAPLAVRLLAGLGVPAALVAAWAVFGARNAARRFHGPARVGFETVWFGVPMLLLALAGLPVLAAVLAAGCLASKVAAAYWRR